MRSGHVVIDAGLFDDPGYPLIRDERELALTLRADEAWWAKLGPSGQRRFQKRKKNEMCSAGIGFVRVWTFMAIGGAWVGHARGERGVDLELVFALMRLRRLRVVSRYFSTTTLEYHRRERA